MNISFKYGYYVFNKLFEVNADLNVSPEYYAALKNELKIKKIKNCSLVRVGLGNKDGGYIMAQNFYEPGIAYSFGICNDVSWDNVMAELGYNIFMYDHTIEKLPYNRPEFHYFKEGIAGKDVENVPLKTLEYYINFNNHKKNKNMILKMDVEGAEWDFLETVPDDVLKQFDQIVFEYHNILKIGSEKYIKLLNKLNKTHQLIHLHGNNSGMSIKAGNAIFCDVLEASYVNKDNYEFEESCDISLPIDMDAPNDTGRPDIILGSWNEPFVAD